MSLVAASRCLWGLRHWEPAVTCVWKQRGEGTYSRVEGWWKSIKRQWLIIEINWDKPTKIRAKPTAMVGEMTLMWNSLQPMIRRKLLECMVCQGADIAKWSCFAVTLTCVKVGNCLKSLSGRKDARLSRCTMEKTLSSSLCNVSLILLHSTFEPTHTHKHAHILGMDFSRVSFESCRKSWLREY